MAKFATNASGAIWWPNLELMQVVPSGSLICNQCNWRYLVAKFGTNASGAIWWTILQLMQIAQSQVIDSIPWVRCASGNVLIHRLPFRRFSQMSKEKKRYEGVLRPFACLPLSANSLQCQLGPKINPQYTLVPGLKIYKNANSR